MATESGTVRGPLDGQRVLVIGRSAGIARAIAEEATASGASLIVAGRNVEALDLVYGSGAEIRRVDITDEASVEALAEVVGPVDHIVVAASARARGPVATLKPETVLLSLQTKVVGPLLVAKHFADRIRAGGSIVLASGATAQRPSPQMTAVAATNGAVDALTRSLAVELAPIRVNAFAPGIIDSGAWDALGDAKADFLSDKAASSLAGRTGTIEDVATAATFLMANGFVTGITLAVDGGETVSDGWSRPTPASPV